MSAALTVIAVCIATLLVSVLTATLAFIAYAALDWWRDRQAFRAQVRAINRGDPAEDV